MRKLLVIPLFVLFSQAHAGIISSIGKAAVEGAETIGGKLFNKSDDAAKHLPDSSDDSANIFKRFESDESKPKTFGEALEAAKQARSDGSIHLLERPPSNLVDEFGDRGFNNFWTWWIGLKGTKALVQNFEEELEKDKKQVNSTPTFNDEVKIKDGEGNFTFNYLVNPAISEARSAQDDEEYMSGMSDIVALLTVGGRIGGFDPVDSIDFKRVNSSSTADFVGFDANLLAAMTLRKDKESADFFAKHLEGSVERLFSETNFYSGPDQIIGCVSMLFSANGYEFRVLPGSSELFNDHCAKESMFKMANAFSKAVIDVEAEASSKLQELGEAEQKDVQSRLAVSKFTADVMTAFVAAMYQEPEEYFLARNRVLNAIENSDVDDAATALSFSMLSHSEFILGNNRSAFQMAKMALALGQEQKTVVLQSSSLLSIILVREGNLRKAAEMFEIQRVMAHPKSKFFVPVDSKIALAESLLAHEFFLAMLDGA